MPALFTYIRTYIHDEMTMKLHDEMTDTIVLLEQYLTQALSGKDRTLLGGLRVHRDHARQQWLVAAA